jgi:methionine biosynthesis protein MetW
MLNERGGWVYNEITKGGIDPGSDVLDLGCGRGQLLDVLLRRHRLKCVGVDVENRLENKEIAFINHDLNRPLPISDLSFDIITILDVIEHINNPRLLLREAFRVCRPFGQVYITTPNIGHWKRVAYLALKGRFPKTAGHNSPYGYDGGHIHFFTHKDVEALVFEAGFDVMGLNRRFGLFYDDVRVIGCKFR